MKLEDSGTEESFRFTTYGSELARPRAGGDPRGWRSVPRWGAHPPRSLRDSASRSVTVSSPYREEMFSFAVSIGSQ